MNSTPTNNSGNKTDQSLNIVDLALYLLSKWKWYVLSILICGGVAWYLYASSPRVFFRSATVIIKDPSNKTSTAGLDRYDNYINKVNVANELLQFKTKRLMREVVKRTNADVNYLVENMLRTDELYTLSPVRVAFHNVLPERYIAFNLKVKDEKTVVLSDFEGLPQAKESYSVRIGDSLKIGSERFVIAPTDQLNSRWVGNSIRVQKMPLSAVASRYISNLGIRQEEDEASILTLSLKDNSPTRADDVLNALINIYNEEAISDKNQVAVNTSNFINERLIIIERELSGVETDLEDYKRANDVVDLGATTSRYMGESQDYSQRALEQETQLKLVRFIKEYLVDPSHSRDLIPSGTGISDANIESQISQYNAMKLKRDKLIGDSSEENPVVEELNNSLHALRQSIIRAIDNTIVSINVKRNDASSRQHQAQARVASIPTKERQLLSIERQQKIKESLYLFLLNRREENALSQAMADNNARIIDSVDGPGGPISPNRNRIILLGVLIGAAIPTVVFLMILFMDTRVHSRKDLKGAVSMPFLGEIPQDKELAKQKNPQQAEQISEDGKEMLSESFRILRTNLAFMTHNQQRQVITMCSFNVGAGKTFVTRNLALSLVFAHKRVLLIDLDLRKASLSHFMSHHHSAGMTDYLADATMTLDSIIHTHDKYDTLDYIVAGTTAPNPAELLMDKRLDEAIAELRTRYDYIIIDNVPVGIIADATISNRIADLTIFVVRAGMLDRRQLPDLEELYKENKLKNMAFVLNGVNPKYQGYGYHYGYGYGYGYGKYGYGYGYYGNGSHHRGKKKKK